MKTLLLIDGNSLMYRAYYATAHTGQLMQTRTGVYTNALYGFIKMTMKVSATFQPTHALVAFDAGKQTFRHQSCATYKAGRQAMPEEMRGQIEHIKTYLDLIGMPRLELLNYEADDLIGTYATLAVQQGFDQVNIITGDKDLLQIASDRIIVHITRKGVSEMDAYTATAVKEKIGLTPAQVTDLKGLMGDKSDNIPGVPGVGQKTAVKWLQQYGTIETLITRVSELSEKQREKMETYQEQALWCKQLATLKLDVPVAQGVEMLQPHVTNANALRAFYQAMEFDELLKYDRRLQTRH